MPPKKNFVPISNNSSLPNYELIRPWQEKLSQFEIMHASDFVGLVIPYRFVWPPHITPKKTRPALIYNAVMKHNDVVLSIIPITKREPVSEEEAVLCSFIHPKIKSRLGLTTDYTSYAKPWFTNEYTLPFEAGTVEAYGFLTREHMRTIGKKRILALKLTDYLIHFSGSPPKWTRHYEP